MKSPIDTAAAADSNDDDDDVDDDVVDDVVGWQERCYNCSRI